MTNTAQDDFLKRLAEALGWEQRHGYNGLFPSAFVSDEEVSLVYVVSEWAEREGKNGQGWLLTNDGMAYLVQRARAEGYCKREILHYPEYDEVYVGFPYRLQDGTTPEPKHMWYAGQANTELLATALAVAEGIGVKLPEGAVRMVGGCQPRHEGLNSSPPGGSSPIPKG